MKFKIKFQKNIFVELQDFYKKSSGSSGCFILANINKNLIFVTELILPTFHQDGIRKNELCFASNDFASESIKKVKKTNDVLIYCNHHPDDNSIEFLREIHRKFTYDLFLGPSRKIVQGSLLFNGFNIFGKIFYEGSIADIDSYTILGRSIEIIYDNSIPHTTTIDSEKYNRQLPVTKEKGAIVLQNLNVGIVGLGGIGSPLAMMLAKIGVGKINLIDHDIVEKHNIPRIIGASEKDIGCHKVHVVKRFLDTFSDSEIEAIESKIDHSFDRFHEFDILFGCLDKHTPRAILNNAAIKFAIPYIDAGCAIPLGKNGDVIQAVTSTMTVLPSQACLWCADVLDGMKIQEESFSDEERQVFAIDGYLKDLVSAPSVISLTNLAASFSANRFFNLLGIYTEGIPVRTIFEADKFEPLHLNPLQKTNCKCRKNSPFRDNV